MTRGAARGHLCRYALPLMLGNWLQLTYNAADAVIAGRFIGQDALAAAGIAAPVMNLVILAISGLCVGAGVLMSEAFGAGDTASLRRILATTLLFGAAASALVAVLGLGFAPLILTALGTPPEILAPTAAYLRVTFLGAPFVFFYNALSAGFKSVGDTKNPLRFLAFSSVLNLALDLVFIGLLGFGIVCSAITTVVAQVASAALVAFRLTPELRPERGQWRIDTATLRRILGYGGPAALQQAIQPICKVLIQGQVNALGVGAIAAYNAVTRIDDFACIPEQSVAQAITTYIAQNRGAGKTERIRPGFAAGLRLEVCYWLLIGTLTLVFRQPVVALFITGDGAERVVALGSRYLGFMAFFYLLPGLTNGFQGFYRGMGKMRVTLLGTFVQASLRALFAALLAPRLGLPGIAVACAIGWCCMLAFEIPYYFFTCQRQKL